MPAADDRIRDALRATALEPAVDDVSGRVMAKREHRRAVRRAQTAVAGVAAVALVAVGALVLVDDATERQVAVRPRPGALPVVRTAAGAPRPDAGSRATVEPVRVPSESYLRGPLLEGKGGLALAAYDRSGSSYTFPPSHIVRVNADGDVVDRVDLQGEILSLADGEGARWALTRDKTVIGPQDPEFRVKRIGPDGSVLSNAVLPGEQPAGPIVAGGGGVWVPTRTAVLRFDVVTGELAASIPMDVTADRRAVVNLGKAAYVSDGSYRKRLDPASDQAIPAEAIDAGEIDDLAGSGSVVWTLVRGADGALSNVVRSDEFATDEAPLVLYLPEEFEASGVFAAAEVAWVEGTFRGDRHVLLVLDVTGEGRARKLAVERTVRLARTDDVNVVFHSPDEVLLTSNGSLFRVRIPE